MRLLDEVSDELRNESGSDFEPLGGVIRDLRGGPRGTLPDLADRFTAAGLGRIMASWIHNGPNLPITADQLRVVLGEERTQDFATATGLPPNDFLWKLARHLPRVIDRMTPDGQVEAGENPGGFPA
jgi:uncharacterized protein YidB (DUF937 family)